MEVLHYEVVNTRIPLFIVLISLLVAIVLGLVASLEMGKIFGAIVTAVLSALFIYGYVSQKDDYYEYQKVIVSDWNIVHNDGWEVVRQEGEIVELKRKLEEENQ